MVFTFSLNNVTVVLRWLFKFPTPFSFIIYFRHRRRCSNNLSIIYTGNIFLQ